MIYKILLKPLDKFFFGGENGFRDVGDDKNDRRVTYILKSRAYPQQTAALGLIRNQLLLQNKLLWDNTKRVTDRKAAKKLIGPHGFRRNYKGPYGMIRKLGTVFLSSPEGEIWSPSPLDDVKMSKKDSTVAMTIKKEVDSAWLEGYSEKSGCYATLQNHGKAISTKSAFTIRPQVGITKSVRPDGKFVSEEEEESGFYFQHFKSFNSKNKTAKAPDRFCFYVELEERPGRKLESAIVEFGGERSTFQMTVLPTTLSAIPLKDIQYQNTKRADGLASLVCQSPALVDIDKLRPLALLIVSETLSFRFLKSMIVEENKNNENEIDTEYHQAVYRGKDKKQSKGALLESRLFQLMDRGSVIHFDPTVKIKDQEITTLLTELFNQPDLQNIGYNQYTIIGKIWIFTSSAPSVICTSVAERAILVS